jgi:hypothetical protein
VKEYATRPNGPPADEVAIEGAHRLGAGRPSRRADQPDNVQRGASGHSGGQEPARINQLSVDWGIWIGKGEPQATHHDLRATLAAGTMRARQRMAASYQI